MSEGRGRAAWVTFEQLASGKATFQNPLGLLAYIRCVVEFKGEHVGRTKPKEPYQHREAAEHLKVPVSSVRRWFDSLEADGLITSARTKTGLHVWIVGYAPWATRQATPQVPESPDVATLDTPRVLKSEHSQEVTTATSGRSRGSRVLRFEHSHASRVLKNGHSANGESAQIWRRECSDLASRVLKSEQSPIESKEPKIQRDAAAASRASPEDGESQLAASTAAPAGFERLDELLRTLRGYAPTPAFFEVVQRRYGQLDLEQEALRIVARCREKHAGAWQEGTALNVLGLSAKIASQPTNGHAGANGRASPHDVQDRLYRQDLAKYDAVGAVPTAMLAPGPPLTALPATDAPAGPPCAKCQDRAAQAEQLAKDAARELLRLKLRRMPIGNGGRSSAAVERPPPLSQAAFEQRRRETLVQAAKLTAPPQQPAASAGEAAP